MPTLIVIFAVVLIGLAGGGLLAAPRLARR